MTRSLAHRGPDDSGTWQSEGANFGHTRLTILDLSRAGHQPMHLGRTALVFNGEIYNFRSLRAQLKGPFQSQSDSEVLLHLWHARGPAMVHDLIGMFAFAIWDGERRELFLARDRLGVKPLVFRRLPGGGLAFASEIKALLEWGTPTVDPLAVRDYFSYKYIPTPKTIYQGIEKLPAGHTLSWSEKEGASLHRYWQLESSTEIDDPDHAHEVLAPLLREVVEDHTLADVPVGVFLSGGVDSSTVAAQLLKPRTFHLGFDVASHDETAPAREVANILGTEHQSLLASAPDLEEALDRLPGIYDEPFADHGAWPVFLISRLARQHVKVALTGEGGDELFAGYPWYDKFPRLMPRAHHHLAARLLSPLRAGHRSAYRRLTTGLERYSTFLGPFTVPQKRMILTPDLMAGTYDDLWHQRRYWREDLEPIKRLQWIDVHTYLIDDMMTKLDGASMAVSLEARPPLVDHRLVEFALRLSPRVLFQRDRTKAVLRRIAEQRIPRHLLDRPKIGFSMPVRRWVARHPNLLSEATQRLHRAGVLARARLRPHTNEQTWSLLVLDRWMSRGGTAL